MTKPPGSIRDSIVGYLSTVGIEVSVNQIYQAVSCEIGEVAPSSVRSYLNLNTPGIFERTGHGLYRLRDVHEEYRGDRDFIPAATFSKAQLFHADCFEWLANQAPSSIHAVVTDPPYGLVEYTKTEQLKLQNGRGGVWRIPPSFDGHQRAPLPRFTVLDDRDRERLYAFFTKLGGMLARVVVPGGNILVASNPLFSHIVATAMSAAGLELRGSLIRLVMTMRGGDRPKNAHEEFHDVSVMPRSMWEPWVILRKPLEGRVQDNLRRWKTGGFRRISGEKPFGDVIASSPTPKRERRLAPHPSLKPQSFLRQVARAVLPLGEGVILDPFAGSGSLLAAANAIGYQGVGIEADARYIDIAKSAIPALSALPVEKVDPV